MALASKEVIVAKDLIKKVLEDCIEMIDLRSGRLKGANLVRAVGIAIESMKHAVHQRRDRLNGTYIAKSKDGLSS